MTDCQCDCGKKNPSFPYLAFVPVIASLSAVLFLILRSRRGEIPIEKQEPAEPRKSIRLPEKTIQPEPSKPDDLTLIEGIGPKNSAVLNQAGITHYSQLAALKPEVIKEMLVKAGNRVSDPTTWPEQARLAAKGKWDELETLQANLKGGRRE